MDIYCKCGEPWDTGSLHDLVAEEHDREEYLTDGKYDQAKYDVFYKEARLRFRKEGCEAFGSNHSNYNPERGEVAAEIQDLLGDDVDGAASLLSDFDYMRMLP